MKKKILDVLTKISTGTKIASYYSYTQNAFFMLWQLGDKTGDFLEKNLHPFVYGMLDSTIVTSLETGRGKELYKDLCFYILDINITDGTEGKHFEELVNSIFYSNSIILNNEIKNNILIKNVVIDSCYIMNIGNLLDKLRDIKVYKYDKHAEEKLIQGRLIDCIKISCNRLEYDYIDSYEAVLLEDEIENETENEIYENTIDIKAINNIYLYQDQHKKLNNLKKSGINKIDNLTIFSKNSKEFLNISDFKIPIYCLHYLLQNNLKGNSLNSQEIDYLNQANVKKLHLHKLLNINSMYPLLSELRNDLTIQFYNKEQTEESGITLNNAVLFLKQNQYVLKLYCKWVNFYYDESINSDDVTFTNNQIIIQKFKFMSGKITKKEKTNQNSKKTLPNTCIYTNSYENITLTSPILQGLLKSETSKTYFGKISSQKRVLIILKGFEELKFCYMNKEIFPLHAELDCTFSQIDGTDKKEFQKIYEEVAKEYKIISLKIEVDNSWSSISKEDKEENVETFLKCVKDSVKSIKLKGLLKELKLIFQSGLNFNLLDKLIISDDEVDYCKIKQDIREMFEEKTKNLGIDRHIHTNF